MACELHPFGTAHAGEEAARVKAWVRRIDTVFLIKGGTIMYIGGGVVTLIIILVILYLLFARRG